jgi:hypothetical protein
LWATAAEEIIEAEELAEIPSYYFDVPPQPPSSPVLTNLIEDRAASALWSGGVTSLRPFGSSAKSPSCSPIDRVSL